MESTNNRTRMNLSISTKGIATYDVTAEYDTPEIAADNLQRAIQLMKQKAQEEGLTLATE